ncbi:MAG: FAD:protein FMN transferase [Burkholderiaceae bacterium]
MTGIARCRPGLGTYVRIEIRDAMPPDRLFACMEAAFEAIAEVEGAMSFHRPGSDLSRLNAAPPDATLQVHRGLVEVLRFSGQLHEMTDGAFDPGVASRLVEWELLPRPSAAGAALATDASIRDLECIDDTHVRVRRATCIDLGGVAKGYAVDRAIEALRARGATQADVNAGGDLRVLGEPRPVHVRTVGPPSALRRLGDLGDGAVATSAFEELRARPAGSRARSTVVDARTRSPVLDRRSFTVIASECMAADALTKVLAITGRLPAEAARWQAQGLVS